MSRKAIVDFTYNGDIYSIECSLDDKMKDICEVFAKEVGKDLKTVDFLYLNEALNGDLTFEEALKLKKKKGAYGKLVGHVAKGLGL